MKNLSALFFGLTLSLSANAFDIDSVAGNYKGTCTVTYKKHIHSSVDVYTSTQEAALYVGKFTNARGELADLAISTELFASGSLPSDLSFLLKADEEGRQAVAEFVELGLTGTDNNLGSLNTGSSFKLNYFSTSTDDSLVVTSRRVSLESTNGRDFSNPPVLQSCNYNFSQYAGCFRSSDVTTVKKVSEKVLVSERSAAQFGTPVNNYSFYLPEIASVCVWEKQ